MSFLMPKISMPAVPQMEMPKTESVPSWEDEQRKKEQRDALAASELKRKGRRSTILTGGTGLTTEAELNKKSLLGG